MRSPPSAAVVVVVVVMMVMGLDAEDVLRLTHRQLCFRNIGTSTYASFGDVADLEDGPPLALVHQSGEFTVVGARNGGLDYSTHDIIDFCKFISSPASAFICCVSFLEQWVQFRVEEKGACHYRGVSWWRVGFLGQARVSVNI